MSEVIVSENDIVKYYAPEEQARYHAFRRFESLDKDVRNHASRREVADAIGLPTESSTKWRDTVRNWRRESRPSSVDTVDFLRNIRLMPLLTDSPKLGLLAYVVGLNWHAGSIHIGKSSADCPQFYVAKYDKCASLPGVASALRVPLAPDPRLVPEPKYDRFTMPSAMALLLTELGIPSNGSKADFAEPYPEVIDTLLMHDRERVGLFLGAQLLTQASRHSNQVLVSTIPKNTEELAQRTGTEMYHLYREVFPHVEIGAPELHAANGKFYSTTQMSRRKYDGLVEKTHKLLRQEAYRANELS